MFTIKDEHVMAAFFHSKCKQSRIAISAQISDCCATCPLSLLPDSSIAPIRKNAPKYNRNAEPGIPAINGRTRS
jgi:hypothetical protein